MVTDKLSESVVKTFLEGCPEGLIKEKKLLTLILLSLAGFITDDMREDWDKVFQKLGSAATSEDLDDCSKQMEEMEEVIGL